MLNILKAMKEQLENGYKVVVEYAGDEWEMTLEEVEDDIFEMEELHWGCDFEAEFKEIDEEEKKVIYHELIPEWDD